MIEQQLKRQLLRFAETVDLAQDEALLRFGVGEVDALHELGVQLLRHERLGKLSEVVLQQTRDDVDFVFLKVRHRLPTVCNENTNKNIFKRSL